MEGKMSFKTRLQRAFPVWRQLLKRNTPIVRQGLIAGGVAGAIAVAGIKKGDQLVSVLAQNDTSYLLSDVSSDFIANTDTGQIIRKDGYVDSTGGADATGSHLLITWVAWAE